MFVILIFCYIKLIVFFYIICKIIHHMFFLFIVCIRRRSIFYFEATRNKIHIIIKSKELSFFFILYIMVTFAKLSTFHNMHYWCVNFMEQWIYKGNHYYNTQNDIFLTIHPIKQLTNYVDTPLPLLMPKSTHTSRGRSKKRPNKPRYHIKAATCRGVALLEQGKAGRPSPITLYRQ